MLILEDHPFALAYKLVEEGKLDPWNVDIVELANAYLEEIKKMEVLDMRIPARVISAAIFLLRKKLEVLFPPPKRHIERKRHYTLEEIVQEFEEENETQVPIEIKPEKAKKVSKNTKTHKKKSKASPPSIPIHVSRFEDVLKEVWELISLGIKSFSLLELFSDKNLAPYLMALMTLYAEGKIEIHQKEPYGDLFIEVV